MVDETLLIQESQNGNLDSFNQLILLYQGKAFNLAYRILWDEEAAEDAAQTAFISAFRGLKSFRGGSFRSWLLRMVTNSCYDELRRRKRHPNISLEPRQKEDDMELDSPSWMMDKVTLSPEKNLEALDMEHALQHCIQNLPEDFRIVVLLVDLEELDYMEVSRVVGKPLGTIKSRVARARLRLRDCLNKFGELLPDQYRLGIENNK